MRLSRAGLLRLEGCNYTLGRIAIAFKACGEDTNGAYTLCETVEPSGSNARLHRHPTYDETFIICEGRFSFRLGDETMELGPGETVFEPRGTKHAFTCIGTEPGRQLIISSPGGIFEAFIADVVGAVVSAAARASRGRRSISAPSPRNTVWNSSTEARGCAIAQSPTGVTPGSTSFSNGTLPSVSPIAVISSISLSSFLRETAASFGK